MSLSEIAYYDAENNTTRDKFFSRRTLVISHAAVLRNKGHINIT